VNLSGGFYDVGDNVKFGWPMAYTVALLSWAAIEYSEQINSVGQLDYLRSEIRWGADYILKAHVSPNKLYTQVGDGKRDHACWERPEDMDTPRTVIEINTNSPGTEVAADSAAALAAASIVFKGVDPDYSSRLLKHSKSLFRFGDKHRGSYQGSCPFYCSYSGLATQGEWREAVLKVCSSSQGTCTVLGLAMSGLGHCQSNKLRLESGKHELETFKRGADSFVCAIMPNSGSTQIRTTPGGLLYTRDSSNLQYASSASMVLLAYSLVLVGYSAGYTSYFSSTKPNLNIHVGAIVGGPNSNDGFSDIRSDHSHLEPTTYKNAAFVGSVTAFLHENFGQPDQ
ncbi:endoglucanase, partial [Tanacetum coccineum]